MKEAAPWLWWALAAALGFLALVAFLPRAALASSSEEMPTVAAKKKPAAKKTARKPIPSWIGSAKGKVTIKPGVDLTKPTLPPGKYL